jgi:hypothetical protein
MEARVSTPVPKSSPIRHKWVPAEAFSMAPKC